VDPVPDPLLLRKSGSAGNWTRDLCICSQKLLLLIVDLSGSKWKLAVGMDTVITTSETISLKKGRAQCFFC